MIIGKVALAPGRAGYYDDKTKIHLSIAQPECPVYDYMDTSNLKNSVKVGTINLIFGSLDIESEREIPIELIKEVEQNIENEKKEAEQNTEDKKKETEQVKKDEKSERKNEKKESKKNNKKDK